MLSLVPNRHKHPGRTTYRPVHGQLTDPQSKLAMQRVICSARVSALLLFVVATAARGADLAPVLRPILEKHKEMPGLVGAILDGEKITAIGAVGVRKFGAPERIRNDDLVHL